MSDLVARLRERAKNAHWKDHDCMCDAADDIDRLRAQVAELEQDVAYLTAKLTMVMPLFEEARDALPAITLVSAKLHNVSLSLGDRMDKAGTYRRADWDAAIDKAREGA